MEGFMIQNNIKHVPYAIGIIDTNPNRPENSRQAWDIIPQGVPFPASGRTVMKVLDAVDNTTTLNVAELDRKNREYALFETITVKGKKLRTGDPLELYAEYKDPSSIYIVVSNGKNGRELGSYNLKIRRPEYKAPVAPQRSVSTASKPVESKPVKTELSEENKRRIERLQKLMEENPGKRPSELLHEDLERERRAEARAKENAIRNEKMQQALAELDSLVGLKSVKESVQMLIKRLEYENMRNETLGGAEGAVECPRFVFNGNPGTGKTTVARLIGDICYGCGLIDKSNLVEVSRSDLVGEYVGQTGKMTKAACEKAYGGVLFVDEAYALVQKNENDFGKEAIAVLIKEMEDHRNDMVVILAGYTDDMEELLNTNSGIKSRITDTITFDDYSTEELFQIADAMAAKKNYNLTSDGKKAFEYLINAKKVDKKFGNAREVRNLLDKAISKKALLFAEGIKESLTELTSADFGVDLNKNVEASSKDIMVQLERMIGLESVKKNVKQVISKAKYMMHEVNDGNMAAEDMALNMNLCFTGNPGTGKTTVARLYAQLLHSIGLTKTDKVLELTRSDLVAPYMGQTAIKTKEACEKAYGGVMFIDEAYSLVQGPNDTFGMEALDTLIKEMEDNRDKLVVILAGYTKEMNEFMDHNSGLKSRISRFVEFEDYSVDELYSIFKILVKDKGCTIDADASLNAKGIIMDMVSVKDRTFGNAREIRKLLDDIFMNMIVRVEDNELAGSERRHIINEDVVTLSDW